MDIWKTLGDVVIVLCAAMLLGSLCERLKQNALIGYLLAGVVLGPGGVGVVRSVPEVHALAELGVALLLFTIGAEFSLRRLREVGSVASIGGTLQILVTGVAVTGIAVWLGLPMSESIAVGAAVSVSSTAVVLRVLLDRSELDSLHGRNALGILLMQDLAVVPLVVLMSILGMGGADAAALGRMGLTLLAGGAIVGGIYLAGLYLHPHLLRIAGAKGNRDLPVLLGVVICMGMTYISHAAGLSPILGAFVGGMLVAESPFAEQVRADISALRAIFVTLFFASAGMLATFPTGVMLAALVALVVAIVVIKMLITGGVVRLLRNPRNVALASGLVLSQIGEFSFVLLEAGHREGVVSELTFQMLQSASVLTLLLTPYLIALASRVASGARPGSGSPEDTGGEALPAAAHDRERVIVVGYGPAGQQVVKHLLRREVPFLVLDLNTRTVAAHRSAIPIEFGDSTLLDILLHVGIRSAKALIVTIPDPRTASMTIRQARLVAPDVLILARARYHIHGAALLQAGADHIVGEEDLVGDRLADAFLEAGS